MTEVDFRQARHAMVRSMRWEIGDRRVLAAIDRVPRERFVPEELRRYSYEDRPLPIGYGQTISQPLMVAIMTSTLDLQGDEKVLEIGTGSGYQAAVLAELAREVVTVERVPELAERAEAALRELGYGNVRVHPVGPVLGRPEDAPYDAIVVTAAAPRVPQSLVDQLRVGGRLAIPVGSRAVQELLVVTKKTGEELAYRRMGECRFVPLIAEGEAWSEYEGWG